MKNVMGLLILSIMSISCVRIEGNLSVNQPLSANRRGGFLNLQMKKADLKPGNYHAILKINSEKSLTLKIKGDKDSRDILIPIKNKKGLSIPRNGEVLIRGSEIDQPFDVSAAIQTNVTQSDSMRGTEACTFEEYDRFCETVCTEDRTMGTRCYTDCRDILVTRTGHRHVEYHNRYTSRDLNLNLLDQENEGVVKASFVGKNTDVKRVYEYIGQCY